MDTPFLYKRPKAAVSLSPVQNNDLKRNAEDVAIKQTWQQIPNLFMEVKYTIF